ncbi:3-deoxy-manno-octulosonate cytidylyltransferase [Futiania mangrovi]|uniref:3-deoxy-manno-octulosonate cytidylyltransferase n=1 Tax=Futiania mangrovi TaxID=2959716 RepID=A0A9J6PEN6_9PROT|nr:3-deoxy-manno-octulosonate cytidylyltransferase [Futiania mangrovii]MCP1336886.1 3-deoxy-manno-octulosonate cytidylyltransferase [Futiania mangrovii]
MTPLIVIPARMAATRLPGKPLADIHGTPMIVHAWRRATAAGVGPVAVAAGDREIVDAVEAAGGTAVLTDPALPSGSDRVWQGVERLDPSGRHDVIVNLQGDLPDISPASVARVLDPLRDPDVDIATVVAEITDDSERDNPNVVKAAVAPGPDGIGRALYFSRARVPSGDGPHWHHVGIYAFRREALKRFVSLPPSGLELRERLEQLRAMEAGMRIDAAVSDMIPVSVDTPEDLERARARLAGA